MFDAVSWDPWRVFLKALQGLPMDDGELAVFRHHTSRTVPPTSPARYAELVCGRRGGKSRILALIATYLSCVIDHRPHIVPGETPVVAVIAKDRTQATVIKNYISGLMREVPTFAAMIADEISETLRLTNGVSIEIHTASVGAPRGRTFLAVLADESAFWPTGDAPNADIEVINAVRPGLATIPYSLLLIASSPYAKRGILYQNYARYFGKDGAPTLVWQGTTEEMNSGLIDDPLIAEMYAEDPERASAEFGAQFRSDIVAFITREAVEDCLAGGVREIPPGGGITYVAHVDPSGGSADSMTLAIAHVEPGGLAVLDLIRERKPPFSPDDVVAEFAEVLKAYNVTRVVGDAYAGVWPRERFAVHGITYDVSDKNTSAIYLEFLPALNAKRVQLLDLPRLFGQLVGLERKTTRGGRDSIAHAPGSHDDVANVVCGALVQVIEDRRPTLILKSDLVSETPAVAHSPNLVSGIVWVNPDGLCGWAACAWPSRERNGLKMVVEDCDCEPWGPGLLDRIAGLMNDLAESAHGRWPQSITHCVMMVPEQLKLAAEKALNRAVRQPVANRNDAAIRMAAMHNPLVGMRQIGAQEINARLLADPADLLMSAMAFVKDGAVKFGAGAMARSTGRPLLGALDVRAGEVVTADPLRMALLLEIRRLGPEPPRHAEGAALRFG
jgi:hypothetical protein